MRGDKSFGAGRGRIKLTRTQRGESAQRTLPRQRRKSEGVRSESEKEEEEEVDEKKRRLTGVELTGLD